MELEERDKKILLNFFAKKLLFAWQWSRKEKGGLMDNETYFLSCLEHGF